MRDEGGMCGEEGMHGSGVMHGGRGGGCKAKEGMCDDGGMHGKGGVQERWPVKRAIRILLECILVNVTSAKSKIYVLLPFSF